MLAVGALWRALLFLLGLCDLTILWIPHGALLPRFGLGSESLEIDFVGFPQGFNPMLKIFHEGHDSILEGLGSVMRSLRVDLGFKPVLALCKPIKNDTGWAGGVTRDVIIWSKAKKIPKTR